MRWGRKKLVRTVVLVGSMVLAALVAAPSSAHAAPAVPVPAVAVHRDPVPLPSLEASTGGLDEEEDEEQADTAMETVRYGKHRRQRMDVWWQPDGRRHPGVFVIHGGWWSGGDKKSMAAVARAFAERGYTVFNINYRLSGDAPWPAQRIDAIDAIGAARRHAARWSFDPKRYALLGFSAGGHIATAVGTYKNGVPGLRGVVGVSPVVSPLTAYADGAGTLDPAKRRLRAAAIRLAGGCRPTGKCARIWASMEVPWHASRGDAPVLAVHSDDEFVPPAQSELLRDALRKAGVGMSIRRIAGIEHSTALFRILGVEEGVQDWIADKLA